jgi:UDP-galactopyranose mutase
MLVGSDVMLNTDYSEFIKNNPNIAKKIIYTGEIDKYYSYCYGHLDYRSLRFETEVLDKENFQGNAVINYTEREVPYTRVIEHKHFEFGTQPKTVITKEYPQEFSETSEPYYPVNNSRNNCLYAKYKELASKEKNVIFGGRLGEYKYFDMDKVIESALKLANSKL